ncbi:MAG: MFS transporter [Alphaproteobacteria bacterium]|nr:MFS transporter [Alphaproteobacteria bacterium]
MTSLRRAIHAGIAGFPILACVAAASLLLLLYIGWSEVSRVQPRFQFEKLAAQSELLASAMDPHVQAGLPLEQFAGFDTIARSILESDETIEGILVLDRTGRQVFAVGPADLAAIPADSARRTRQPDTIDARRGAGHLQVARPLHNRFETVGEIIVSMPESRLRADIDRAFAPLLPLAVLLATAFPFACAILARRWSVTPARLRQAVLAAFFCAMAAAVMATMIQLYADGVQAKARALGASLGHRLASLIELGLTTADVTGLDQTFAEYRRNNPDIAAAALVVDGIAVIHSDPGQAGQPWRDQRWSFEHGRAIDPLGHSRAFVVLPADAVWSQLLRGIRSFAALFVASALLAAVFLQLAASARGGRETPPARDGTAAASVIHPVFFAAVFIEHMIYPFLPGILQSIVQEAGLGGHAVSLLFMSYFLMFALSLMPASALTARLGARPVMLAGAAAILASFVLLALAQERLALVLAARLAAGLGQGFIFIAVQQALLSQAGIGQKAAAASVIVTGFQGGMISGVAIGSLLVVYLGPAGVIHIALAIAAGLALLIFVRFPRPAMAAPATIRRRGTWRDLGTILTDADFLKAMLAAGIPAKMVMTGCIVFALPIMLGSAGFAQDDIGQIIMLYALGVLLCTGPAARLCDRLGRPKPVVLAGGVLSALGLVALAASIMYGINGGDGASIAMAGAALASFATGIAHGCINAPIVSHVASGSLAARIGEARVTASYRLLERIGHIAGPLVAGQALMLSGTTGAALLWIAAGLAILTLLFSTPERNARPVPVAA